MVRGSRVRGAVWPVPCPLLPQLMRCGQGEEMDTRDKVVSLVGYLLFVAMALAVIAAVMTH
jgi:hypothetical protein